MISLLEAGVINFTLPRTTSGIEAIAVVRSGLFIATLSVWTDQNPSDNDGATIISELAIKVRRSSFSKPSKIWTEDQRWYFLIFSLIYVVLLESMRLKTKSSFASTITSSGKAQTK